MCSDKHICHAYIWMKVPTQSIMRRRIIRKHPDGFVDRVADVGLSDGLVDRLADVGLSDGLADVGESDGLADVGLLDGLMDELTDVGL